MFAPVLGIVVCNLGLDAWNDDLHPTLCLSTFLVRLVS